MWFPSELGEGGVSNSDLVALWRIVAKLRKDSGDQKGAEQARANIKIILIKQEVNRSRNRIRPKLGTDTSKVRRARYEARLIQGGQFTLSYVFEGNRDGTSLCEENYEA